MYSFQKICQINSLTIKTHGWVLLTKKDVQHMYTSVLFTETAKSLFISSHISITPGLICTKVTYIHMYVIPSIYMTLRTKCEENQLSSL